MLPLIPLWKGIAIIDSQSRFRWAVCQTDALKRLKCERDVVRKALANLPKNLVETYDRIFFTIPEEESLFVQHVLHEIHKEENISCAILLQGVEKSIARLKPATCQNERFYDHETLWELCGCLISKREKNIHYGFNFLEQIHTTTSAVSFAHYTVREYLDSPRHLRSLTDYSTEFTEILFSEAVSIQPNELWNQDRKFFSDNDFGLRFARVVEADFNVYSVLYALKILRRWPKEAYEQDRLCNMVIDLLNPSEPHFHMLAAIMRTITEATFYFSHPNWQDYWHFWKVEWIVKPSNLLAAHLLNLLTLRSSFINYSLVFAKKFLDQKNDKSFLKARLIFNAETLDSNNFIFPTSASFDGSIIEVFAQTFSNNSTELLLEYGKDLYDPSKILPLALRAHGHYDRLTLSLTSTCQKGCVIDRLLEHGADPNIAGYKVTPLQISTHFMDGEAVRKLIDAGADPNGTGDSDGIGWGTNSLMRRFNDLDNASPLHICRNYTVEDGFAEEKNNDRVKYVESILVQHGAQDFVKP